MGFNKKIERAQHDKKFYIVASIENKILNHRSSIVKKVVSQKSNLFHEKKAILSWFVVIFFLRGDL
jgi:hypothetical protein